ncbi:MAG: acyl-CoA thioesterase [Acidimicrobiales bacterium]
MPSRFATDTAATPLGAGRYTARVDPGWWIERGPNGGYVAALILRAVTAEVADPDRQLRSFTVHYLAPPTEGDVEIAVTVERQGRSMTSASARLVQEDRLLAIAVGAFSTSRPSIEFCTLVMPEVEPPEALEPMPTGEGTGPVMRERYEQRWALGPPPFSGGDEALSGGWIRLARHELGDDPAGLDQHLLVAMADAWMPPVFGRITEPAAVPTIDLTVHLRSPQPVGVDDWVLVVFRSTVASDGFIEEDGELWSRDGTLLAQSRQLAVFLV